MPDFARHFLGVARRLNGEIKAVMELHQSGLALCQELDDERGAARCLGARVALYLFAGFFGSV